MDQVVDFDWPWWTIETLLQWIGKDEEEGFDEIHKNAEHLDFTGERGPLHPRFWELKPRAGIPDIDFASGCFLNLDGYYVYVPSYPNRTVPEGWEYLLLRAANAKAIWPPPSNASEARVDGDDGQTKSPEGDQPASFRPGNPDEQCSPTSAPISGALLTGAIQSPEPEEMLSSTTAETTETENVDIAKASSEMVITPADTKDVEYLRGEAAVVESDPEKQSGNTEWPLSHPDGNAESGGEDESAAEPDVDVPVYRTGLVGRPTSWCLVKAECRRRYETGERHPNSATGVESSAEWARVLIAWLASAHPQAPAPTPKTLTNRLPDLFRELRNIGRPI